MTCYKCGSENVVFNPVHRNLDVVLMAWKCFDCGHRWQTSELLDACMHATIHISHVGYIYPNVWLILILYWFRKEIESIIKSADKAEAKTQA